MQRKYTRFKKLKLQKREKKKTEEERKTRKKRKTTPQNCKRPMQKGRGL